MCYKMNSRGRFIVNMVLKDDMSKKYKRENENITTTNDATDLKEKGSFGRTNDWITSSNFDAFTLNNDINLLNSRNKYVELTRSKPNDEEIQFLESNIKGYTNLCAITDIPGCKTPCSICDSCNCTHISDTPSLTSDEIDKNYNNSDSTDAHSANNSKDYDRSPIVPLTKITEVEKGDLNAFNNPVPSYSLKQCAFYDSSTQQLNKNKTLGVIDGKTLDSSLAENTNVGENSEISDSESEIIDDDHDKDFNPDDCCSESSNKDSELSTSNFEEDGDNDKLLTKNIDNSNMLDVSLAEKIKAIRQQEKKTARCKYCKNDIVSKNFMRHLERSHINEKEVKSILSFPKKSKERRQAMGLLRNETNFELYIQGTIRPYRQIHNILDKDIMYYPCAYCKGLFLKQYLKRHAKSCMIPCKVKGNKRNYLSTSHTITACALDPTNVISKLNVKEKVFDLMKGDEIAFESKKDLLIANLGESYLKKHRRERMTYVCSNKMRELGRLLISYREIVNDKNITFKDILCPKNFDLVLSAVRKLVNYDPIKKTFQSPSLAMHLGTSLKEACDELYHLILKESTGFTSNSAYNTKLWLKNVESFKKLVESRWNTELASLANKDLQEKRWKKPLLLPLVSDVKKFRDEVLKFANDCEKTFADCKDNESTYKTLVQCTLALLIIFNRRRIGDVQFLKIVDYNDYFTHLSNEPIRISSQVRIIDNTKLDS